MRKPIILSGKSDPDLISLYKALGKKDFIKLIKDSLRSLVRVGYRNEVTLPNGQISTDFGKEERIIVGLTFSDVKDADVTLLLEKCQPRMCGLFIKQVLRFHVGGLLTLPAFLNEECRSKLNVANAMQVLILGGMPIQGVSYEMKPKRRGVTEKKEKIGIPVKEKLENREAPIPVSIPTPEYNIPIMGSSPLSAASEPISNNENVDEEAEMLSLLDGLLGD